MLDLLLARIQDGIDIGSCQVKPKAAAVDDEPDDENGSTTTGSTHTASTRMSIRANRAADEAAQNKAAAPRRPSRLVSPEQKMRSAQISALVEVANEKFEERQQAFTTEADDVLAKFDPSTRYVGKAATLAFEHALRRIRRNRLYWDEPQVKAVKIKMRSRKFDPIHSIWGPRAKWSDSRNLYDTEETSKLRFRKDWPFALELGVANSIKRFGAAGLEAYIERAPQKSPDVGLEDAVEAIALVLERTHNLWYHLFSYYASLNNEIDYLTLNTWTQMLNDCKIIDERSEYCKKFMLETLFVEVDSHASRFDASHDRRVKALDRTEFFVALIRLAINRSVRTKRELDVARALENLLNQIEKRVSGPCIASPNDFRKRLAYGIEINQVLRLHETQLRSLFAMLAEITPYSRKDDPIVGYYSWVEFLREVQLLGSDLPERSATLCFAWSRTLVVDPRADKQGLLSGRAKEAGLPFEGFLEAMVHAAALKALPTDEEVRTRPGIHPRHAGVYIHELQTQDRYEYIAMLEQRTGTWGHVPKDEPLLHQRVAHLIALILHAIDHRLADDSVVGNPRTKDKMIMALPTTSKIKLSKWLKCTSLEAKVKQKGWP